MPVKRTIPYTEGIFSITITCTKWLPLIERVNGYDLIYNWFNLLKSKGHYIVGYVIMPNHMHVMIGFTKTGQSINAIIGNGKRFMAYEIIKRLQANSEHALLNKLHWQVEAARRNDAKQHDVWELSFDWKHCEDEKFITQKLDYFHNNPIKGRWYLCDTPSVYLHSSARFYLTGEQGLFEVTSYAELLDVDLTKNENV